MASQRYTFRDRTFRKYHGEPARTGAVQLDIDWEKLVVELGYKAAFNKTGATRAIKGAIRVRFYEARK